MNNKFWQHSKFDAEGNEISYKDSSELCYSFNPHGQLLYYNDLNQALLDNLPITSDDEKEQLFLDLFKNLSLKADFNKYPNYIFFFKGNDCMVEYDTKNGYFYISYSKIWSVFSSKYQWKYQQIQQFMKDMVEKHFKLMDLTPTVELM